MALVELGLEPDELKAHAQPFLDLMNAQNHQGVEWWASIGAGLYVLGVAMAYRGVQISGVEPINGGPVDPLWHGYLEATAEISAKRGQSS